MSHEHALTLAREIVELKEAQKRLYEERDARENLMLMYFAEAGVKSIRVDDHIVKSIPGKSPGLSPTARRQVRRSVNFAARLGLDQPARITVQKVVQ